MVPDRESFREMFVRLDLPLFINAVIPEGHVRLFRDIW